MGGRINSFFKQDFRLSVKHYIYHLKGTYNRGHDLDATAACQARLLLLTDILNAGLPEQVLAWKQA